MAWRQVHELNFVDIMEPRNADDVETREPRRGGAILDASHKMKIFRLRTQLEIFYLTWA